MRNKSALPFRNGSGYADPTPYEAMRIKPKPRREPEWGQGTNREAEQGTNQGTARKAAPEKSRNTGGHYEFDDGLTPLDRSLIIAKAVFRRYGFEVVGRITLRKTDTGEILK